MQCIPGPCGVEGKEKTDMLAKKNCKIALKKIITFSFSSIKQVLTKKFKDIFRNELHNKAKEKKLTYITHNQEVIPNCFSETAVARFRLTMGLHYLGKRLNKLGLLNNSNCPLFNT